jgi:hypothetical protein
MTGNRRSFLCTAGYVAFLIFIVVLLDADVESSWGVLAMAVLISLTYGYLSRGFWSLLVPLAVIPLAVPAGYPQSEYSEPLPVWVGALFGAPFLMALVAPGCLAYAGIAIWRRESVRLVSALWPLAVGVTLSGVLAAEIEWQGFLIPFGVLWAVAIALVFIVGWSRLAVPQ